jgi:hypothetical protein
MKIITQSGVFSSRRIHDHVHWLRDHGWVELMRADEARVQVVDQRALYIRATEKLINAFIDYARQLSQIPAGA